MFRVPIALLTESWTHPATLAPRLTVADVAGYLRIHQPSFNGDGLDIADILTSDMVFDEIQPRPADRLLLVTQPTRRIPTIALPVGDVPIQLWVADEQALGQLRIASALTVAQVVKPLLAHYRLEGQWQLLYARILSPRTTLDQLPPHSILYGRLDSHT